MRAAARADACMLLHAVDDQRTLRILGEFDDALHAQQAFARLERRRSRNISMVENGSGAVMDQREAAHAVAMAVPVVVVRVMMVMIVRMIVPVIVW